MSTTTTNLGLKKPAANDFYNVQDFNDNADIIDEAVAGKANATHNHAATDITSGTLPLVRGGTGQTSLAGMKSAFGITALENNFTNLLDTDTIQAAKTVGIMTEGVTLLNQILQLYLTNAVVEEYKSGNWRIKKYANGYAECFGRVNVGNVTLNIDLGTDLVSNAIAISFPFTFSDLPEFCSVAYEGSTTGYATLQNYNSAQLTTSKTYAVRLARIGETSITLANNVFNVHVLGKYI